MLSSYRIRIDKETVYSVDDGSFALRVSQERPYTLAIVPDKFLSGSWTVRDAPATVEPGGSGTIVVKRAP